MNRKIVYHIENRGSSYIYHWFLLMIAGLRHIKKGEPTYGIDGSGRFEQNIEFYNKDIDKPPYHIYISNRFSGVCSYIQNDYQKQTIDLLKDDFIFIDESDISEDDIVINNYGEPLYYLEDDFIHNNYVASLNDPNSLLSSKDCYEFLRSFKNKITLTNDDINNFKDKIIFISRKKSHLLEGNASVGEIKRRQIFNEDDIENELVKYGVKFICLEDYTIEQKIKIFMLSKAIISPNSGGLLFCIYSENNTIIELNVENPSQVSKQYYDICKKLNINYIKINCSKIDNNDNMYVDLDNLILELKNNNLIDENSN